MKETLMSGHDISCENPLPAGIIGRRYALATGKPGTERAQRAPRGIGSRADATTQRGWQ